MSEYEAKITMLQNELLELRAELLMKNQEIVRLRTAQARPAPASDAAPPAVTPSTRTDEDIWYDAFMRQRDWIAHDRETSLNDAVKWANMVLWEYRKRWPR